MHHFAFYSKQLECWVVVHELPGTGQLAVDVECRFGTEQTAKRIADNMNGGKPAVEWALAPAVRPRSFGGQEDLFE